MQNYIMYVADLRICIKLKLKESTYFKMESRKLALFLLNLSDLLSIYAVDDFNERYVAM